MEHCVRVTSSQCPKVGIVLANWNGWQNTAECLISLRHLNYPNAIVYVVDNASSDDSETRLRAFDPTLNIIQSGSNLGWAGGCNVGIRAALSGDCEHVYLLNNDAVVRPDTLSRLVDATSLPSAAALGSLVISAADASWAEFAGTLLDKRTHHPYQVSRRLHGDETLQKASVTTALKGCSMLLTAAGLRKVGLFEEAYFLNYDETDWCFRAKAAGMVSYYVPASVIAHKGAASFGGTNNPLYRYFITRNRLLFARRHLDAQGRFFAWRGVVWEIQKALLQTQKIGRSSLRHRRLLLTCIMMAVGDYCLGRFGDCPRLIRRYAHSYLQQ